MDTIALIGALEQVAHALKLPGFAFGKALVAAQNVFASRAPDEARGGTSREVLSCPLDNSRRLLLSAAAVASRDKKP